MKMTYILLAVSSIFSNLYSAEQSNHLVTHINVTSGRSHDNNHQTPALAPNRLNDACNAYYNCIDGLKYCVKLPEELDCNRQKACFWCCAAGCTIPTVALCQAGKITASILYPCLYPAYAMTLMNMGGIEACDFLCDTIGSALSTWAKTPTKRRNNVPTLPSMSENFKNKED